MDKKKFMIHENRFTFGGAVAFLTFIAVAYGCSKICSDFDENPLYYVIISVAVGIVLGLIVAFLSHNVYINLLDDGFMIIEGKKQTKYSYSDFAGSNVVKHSTNGIPTGTTREIKVQRPTDTKPTSIGMNRLSAKQFSEIVSYISKGGEKETLKAEVPAGTFDQKVGFNIPSKEIISANKNRYLLFLVATVSLLVIGVICLIVDNIIDHSIFALIVTGVLGIVFGGAMLILEVFPGFKNFKAISTVPASIVFDGIAMTVDDKGFSANSITNISMVPASYTILTRSLVITTKDGVKHTYAFGPKGKGKNTTYKDYEDLFYATELWCLSNNVNFLKILG